MRYSVRFDEVARQWLVFDTGIAIQVVGIFASEKEAIGFAKKEEERFQKYGRIHEDAALSAA